MEETRVFAAAGEAVQVNAEQADGAVHVNEITQVSELRAVRKQFSKFGWMFFAGTVVIFAAQLITMLIAELVNPEWSNNPNVSLLLSMLPMYLIGIPVLILLLKLIPAQAPERHRMKGGHFAVAAIMCYAVMYIANLAGTLLTTLLGILKGGAVENEMMNLTSQLNLGMIFFFTVICAPIIEEFVFRKMIVDRILYYGEGVAIMLSGFMFGLFHGNMNQFVYATALGIFLAFLYVKTGNLKITIALHMMINFMGGVVSTFVIRLIDLDAYMAYLSEGVGSAMNYIMDNLAGWIVYFVYIAFVFGVMLAGGILIIVFLAGRKFRLRKGAVVIPKGEGFRTAILNWGMAMYCIFWIAMIVMQLFQ